MKRPDSSSSLFPLPPHSLENNQEDYYQVMNKINTASQLFRFLYNNQEEGAAGGPGAGGGGGQAYILWQFD